MAEIQGFDFFGNPGGVEAALDFGFCTDGFEVTSKPAPEVSGIYTRPVLYPSPPCCWEHAQEFADALEIAPGVECFAFVSGNFVFGDLIEALVAAGKLTVRAMGIQTLSMSDENIDSVVNVLQMQPDFNRLDCVLSDYWFAHERKKGGLVDYLFNEWDIADLDLHVGFCGTHAKVTTIETLDGLKVTFHGSANLRSSGNVEQVAISTDPALYDFCAGTLQKMLDVFDVVNQGARSFKSVRRKKLWNAVTS